MVYYPVGTFIPAGFFLSQWVAFSLNSLRHMAHDYYIWRMILAVDALGQSFRVLFAETSALEWCGVVTGTLCVWLAAKNNILNWPVATVSVIIYIFIFFDQKLYSDMELQVYFLVTNIYGWYFWNKNADHKETRPVAKMTRQEIGYSIDGIILFTLISGLIHIHTNATFPFLDSFCTACSIIAQIFLARKTLQTWLIWIFVDVIYVGVYVSKGLYATSIMYMLYIYIATVGYYSWKKIYNQQS